MAIVDVNWLKDHINSRDVIILDVTWYVAKNAKEEYDTKHIPGARWFDIMRDVVNTDMFPRNLPTPEDFERQARSVGVDNGSHVVLYDNTPHCGYFVGSRVWWMFKLHGHQNVSVLDGGMAAWEKAGYQISTDIPNVKEGDFTAILTSRWRQNHADMLNNLTTKHRQVCDARPVGSYHGNPADPLTGHYPGAVNMDMGTILLDMENNKFQTVDKLRQTFAERGVDLNRPITTMCNAGMAACSAALAASLCGATDVSVFMGGFTEWKMKANDGQIEQTSASQ